MKKNKSLHQQKGSKISTGTTHSIPVIYQWLRSKTGLPTYLDIMVYVNGPHFVGYIHLLIIGPTERQ